MSNQVKFTEFHAENPHVYHVLVNLARGWMVKTGSDKVGIGALYERARWEIAMSTNNADFKLNNNFRAFYARLIMANEPDLAGVFDLRSSEADEWMVNQNAEA